MDIPNPSEFDAATSSQKFKCRHLIYEIFSRSDHLRDIGEPATVDGCAVSSEVDGVETEYGVCQTLRIREGVYISKAPAIATMISGADKVDYETSTELQDHAARVYLVETATKQMSDEDEQYLITREWEAFAAVVESYNEDGTLCLDIVNPETGEEFDSIDEIMLLDVLRAMDDSLREEMVFEMIITQPMAGEVPIAETNHDNDFEPGLFIAGHTCERCERTSSFCVHNGNLN